MNKLILLSISSLLYSSLLSGSVSDTLNFSLKPDDPKFSKMDSLWSLEQLSAQHIETDTNKLNMWGYAPDSIPVFSDSLIQHRLSILNNETPFGLVYNQEVKTQILADANSFKMGSPEDPSNFINAVIDEKAFDRIAAYIDYVKEQSDAEIIVGGGYNKSKGYFIEPTIVLTSNPKFKTLCEEIFGPVITIYVYEPKDWNATLELVDNTSEYALTGAIFSTDRYAIEEASKALENAAGNFYINDKPTGAVVGQQPFGGARGSGTNDKAGSILNLLRWVSPRTIKETFVPAKDYRYPFLG